MNRFVLLCSVLLLSLPALAFGGDQVKYVGGTAPGLKHGAVGKLDTTSDEGIVFQYRDSKVVVPYGDIQSFQHTSEVARHLGVLPAIVIALVKPRQKRHFFRIAYCDSTSNPKALPQVLILEVPKNMSSGLEAVLGARASGRGRSCNYWGCWR